MPVAREAEAVAALAASYSAGAAAYRELWAPVLLPFTRRLIGELPVASASRIVEIGSGVGSMLPHLRAAAPAAEIVAVDRAEGMISLAPGEFPRCLMDAMALAFAEDSFDIALLPFMLFHTPDPPGALREAGRVLRPGGSVGVLVWGQDRAVPADDVWEEEMTAAGASEESSWIRNHEYMDTPEKLLGLLAEADFSDIEVSARPLEKRWTIDDFLEFMIRVSDRERLKAMDPSAREAVLANSRERLSALPSEDLVDHSEVLSGRATAAAG